MTKKLAFPAVCVLLVLSCSLAAVAAGPVQVSTNAVWDVPIKADVSAPLRNYPTQPLQVSPRAHAPMQPKGQLLKASGNPRGQALNAPAGKLGPAVGLSFDGISIDPGSPSTENCANIIGGQLAPRTRTWQWVTPKSCSG